jgi:hypothetical protein
MQVDEVAAFSRAGGRRMMSVEMSRMMRLLGVALIGALLGHSAAAQEKTGSIESAEALAKDLKPVGLTQAGVRIQPVQPNNLARSLSKNQHAMMSPPPPRIVSSLVDANLPPSSPKRFSLRGISKGDFLAPTRVRPTDWQHLNLPSVNGSELQNDKDPNVVALPE